jgi:ribosomal protein S18 acetylase RimI-like enzyme
MPIQPENLSLNIRPDTWLVPFIGRDVFKLILNKENLVEYKNPDSALSAELKNLQAQKVFIYSKVSTTDLEAVSLLESRGFHLIDTLVVFEKRIEPNREYTCKCTVRPAEEKDRAAVSELAGKSFIYSRFHMDGDIPKKTADSIKSAWVENFFDGKRGDSMFIAELKGKLAGFILLIEGAEGVLAIDEIAVAAEARRQGTAKDLIAHSERHYRDRKRFTAGTQIVNLPSTRCYVKSGFHISGSSYVLHYHNF